MSENVRVTSAMIQAGANAWPNLDDSTDEKLFGGLFRAMAAADPLAAAERAVVDTGLALSPDQSDWTPQEIYQGFQIVSHPQPCPLKPDPLAAAERAVVAEAVVAAQERGPNLSAAWALPPALRDAVDTLLRLRAAQESGVQEILDK